MRKIGILIPTVSILLLTGGCGGSSSTGSVGNGGGVSLEEFTATLPDGSPMEIEILSNHDGTWVGEFAVAAEAGPYSHQAGTFEGTSESGRLNATCECSDGTEFTMTGRELTNGSLSLSRSDIPGVTLTFQAISSPHIQTRADATFNLNTNGSSGQGSISTTPFSTNASMTEYRGKWRGLNITMWMYPSGYCVLVTNVNDFALNSTNFSSYKLSDVGVKTTTSSSGYFNAYSPVSREITKYGNSVTLSP
jgi:hypothetical protein